MMPVPIHHQAPVPPPSYQRARTKAGKALHFDAVTLVTSLHLLMLCYLAVRLAHRPYQGGQVARRDAIVRRVHCSLHC